VTPEDGTDVHRTPVQELVLEVLAARHRLGERIWTLDRNAAVTSALRVLEKEGLVVYKSGVVQNTYLAYLTDAGKAEMMSADYVPPILKKAE
jgi:hypothetical protein